MSALTGFRISPQQARAWRDAQHGATGRAGSRLAIEVAQPPSAAEIEARLRDLGQREEILRTVLHAVPGMALPIQVIEDQPRVAFATADWRDEGAAQRDVRLAEATLAPGSVLSVRYARVAEERWLLCLEGAASALDLASLALIAAELLGAATEERLQYVDYAEWKNGLLEDEADGQAVRFWQRARTENAPLELHGLQAASAANCRPALHELGGVPPRRELQRAAVQAGLGLDEWLFAAWCVLLARLGGQQRIQLGWYDSGRGEGLEQALGLFEQFLPVQAEVDLQAPLAPQATALLGPLRQARGWRDHYDSAQTCALYFAWRELELPSQLGTPIAASGCHAPFALGLECHTTTDAPLELRLAYDSTRFDANAIACLEEQWAQLLQGLCADDQALGALPLCGPRQEALLQAGTAPAEVRDVGVLALIEERALANPDAPALADGSGVTGYGELLAQVDALARRLRAEGVQAGDVVGILMRRQRQAIVAMLAAMKAGAAYLPLDPAYPGERLSYMIDNSAARLLLSTTELQGSVASNVPTLLLDAAGEVADADIALPSLAGEQTAYLIYTSGSSGQPKGVPISHAALSRSTQVRMAFYPESVRAYLLLSSLSFDSSVAGIYWTLCQGGLLVLPASGEELDLEVLAGLIERHRVSHGLSLPSLYETLLDYCPPATLAPLRTWIVAGEPCTPRVLDKHRGKAAQAQLVNEYGPTEATVWATAEVLSDAAPGERTISIGRPIPGMDLWLLNEQGQPAAIGEPGEIHLGGPTLTSGYLGLPEQTASAFVIAQGQRLYRTGDLARRRVDGRLDFLGRRDQQIKIRGHRVERGEIERVLQSHSEVREAVVIAQPHEGSARLIAYFTDRHGYVPEAQALSSFLHDRLPSYMVPAAFVHLAALPHTPNGKLDLNALPDPEDLVAASAYVAPRNELEAALAEICQQVLKRERIGVQDNFFQIGGDSILSLQIVSRANQQGIRLSAKQIFESETIERMAQVATRGVPDSDVPAACAAAPASAETARTAADFPLADLDDAAFGDLLAELNATD